jgi:hypothetical protein
MTRREGIAMMTFRRPSSNALKVGLVLAFWIMTAFVYAGAQAVGADVPATGGKTGMIRPELAAQIATLQREVEEGGYSFKVGYNPAMDYSIEQLCGLKEPKNWRQAARFVALESTSAALPSSFDWRDHAGVTPVKNQGGCGSCWAFATAGVMESQIKIKCGVVEDVSEQYLVSCNTNGWNCQDGGWWAHGYHENLYDPQEEPEAGSVPESGFPYVGRDDPCGGPHEHTRKLDDWSYIAGYSIPSVQAIKQAIYDHGPVGVAVAVGSHFQGYQEGIFDYNEPTSTPINHAVVLVGWNDDIGPDNGYWILRNSWGSSWGESGYMYIRYNVSRVGYAATFAQFSVCSGTNDLVCTDAEDLALGSPINGSTIGQTGKVSQYLGSTWNESGPETVYRVTTLTPGTITATLSNLSANLDVFILDACDPNNTRAYGDTSATLLDAPAGVYYIVVDGRSGASGSFTLTVDKSCTRRPPQPAAIDTPANDADGSFAVSWPAVAETTGYELGRALNPEFTGVKRVYNGTSTFYNQTGLKPGTYYYRVRAVNACGKSAWTNSEAVVVPVPTLQVTSPNGGQSWKAGTAKVIRWSFTGDPGPDVKIQLFDGDTLRRTITFSTATGTDGLGSYTWTIPAALAGGTNYRIKVISKTNGSVVDTSNSAFSIVP